MAKLERQAGLTGESCKSGQGLRLLLTCDGNCGWQRNGPHRCQYGDLRTTYKKRTLKKIDVNDFEVEGLIWITQMGTI